MPRRQAFVGRDAELAVVLAGVAAAREEQPGLVLVHGEGGAGKTRLLDEVTARVPARTLVCRGVGVGFLGGRVFALKIALTLNRLFGKRELSLLVGELRVLRA